VIAENFDILTRALTSWLFNKKIFFSWRSCWKP